MHKVTARNRPALRDARERNGAFCGEVEVVGGAEGKVGHELEVARRVGAELEVAHGDAVGGGAAEGGEVERLDGAGEAECGWGLGGGEAVGNGDVAGAGDDVNLCAWNCAYEWLVRDSLHG